MSGKRTPSQAQVDVLREVAEGLLLAASDIAAAGLVPGILFAVSVLRKSADRIESGEA